MQTLHNHTILFRAKSFLFRDHTDASEHFFFHSQFIGYRNKFLFAFLGLHVLKLLIVVTVVGLPRHANSLATCIGPVFVVPTAFSSLRTLLLLALVGSFSACFDLSEQLG